MFHKRDSESDKSLYIKRLFAKEDGILKATRSSIETNNIDPINISAPEAKLVQILLKLHNCKTLVEVGTLVGYSAIWAARALPYNGKVYTFEKDPKVAEVAARNFASSDVQAKIEMIVGDAHEKLDSIKNKGPFDAIFIDAEKSGYPKYLDWAEKNLRSGGMIIGDNTFLFGKVYENGVEEDKSTRAMKEFNARLADETKYEGIIIPTNEGMTVALKKF